MHPIIEERLPEVRELCRRHHVIRLELFGSAATPEFDPSRSDLDFLVEFSPEAKAPWMGDYFELKKDLEALFGRPVDLVAPGAIRNPYFQRSVDATRTVVYAQ
jgi:hypothetical protein